MDLVGAKDEGGVLYVDSAYSGSGLEKALVDLGIVPMVVEKGYRNKPLTGSQKASNKEKSKIRARVEHVFGGIKVSGMNGLRSNLIGLARNVLKVALVNLCYNLRRCVVLKIKVA